MFLKLSKTINKTKDFSLHSNPSGPLIQLLKYFAEIFAFAKNFTVSVTLRVLNDNAEWSRTSYIHTYMLRLRVAFNFKGVIRYTVIYGNIYTGAIENQVNKGDYLR